MEMQLVDEGGIKSYELLKMGNPIRLCRLNLIQSGILSNSRAEQS
jgi:hypothetical protein